MVSGAQAAVASAFLFSVLDAVSLQWRQGGISQHLALDRVSAALHRQGRHGEQTLTYASAKERDAATRCFSAYVAYASDGNLTKLEAICSAWREWVTTDGVSPDKVHAAGAAIVLGQRMGSNQTGHYGSLRDGGVDLGCGFNCDRGNSGESKGVHVLSIPVRWFSDCCRATNGSVAHAIAERRKSEVCPMLRDSISGGLSYVGEYLQFDQAASTSDPALLSQCYHKVPEVWTLHLHTTAGASMFEGGVNMVLGPEPYNVCVCEPASRGGRCPSAQPREAAYVAQATRSLCFNIARAGSVPAEDAHAVCGTCN
mmetsp:Transcript_39259/g.117336  ORF Transcript_39259/g.117336 Transcript_39259/m.117336 type:complete len:312 (-) Transcript_39259:132-1067(-)